jgi:hypothetical protein
MTEFHNPWRASLECIMSGDNYLRTQELAELIEELDDLYRYRCGQHKALNDAYAQGRDDQREEDAAICDDEARIREKAGRAHPEDSAERDRCFAASRAAANCAKGIRSPQEFPK